MTDEPPSAAYRALVAERYGRSTWFTAHPKNIDGPTAQLMAQERLHAELAEAEKEAG